MSRGHDRLKQFKGPMFPSFAKQRGPGDAGKKQWIHHCNTRAQIRNLKHICRPILDSKDVNIIQMGQRVLDAVANEPNPGYGALHLIAAGVDAAEQTGITWEAAMEYLLNKFEQMEQQSTP